MREWTRDELVREREREREKERERKKERERERDAHGAMYVYDRIYKYIHYI